MTSNSLPTSIRCHLAISAERRANELTAAALLREVTLSAVSTLLAAHSTALGWYTAYDKRQQRRRHHYRRAVNAVSAKQMSADAVRASSRAVAVDRKPQDLRIVHIAGGEAYSFPKTSKSSAQAVLGDEGTLPPAHVCAEAQRAANAKRGTVTPTK